LPRKAKSDFNLKSAFICGICGLNLNAAEALTQRRKAAEAQGFKSI
jgi:hypothetical protein